MVYKCFSDQRRVCVCSHPFVKIRSVSCFCDEIVYCRYCKGWPALMAFAFSGNLPLYLYECIYTVLFYSANKVSFSSFSLFLLLLLIQRRWREMAWESITEMFTLCMAFLQTVFHDNYYCHVWRRQSIFLCLLPTCTVHVRYIFVSSHVLVGWVCRAVIGQYAGSCL